MRWYDHARRDLPWRTAPGERPDAYAVLVSELMLQQTTVAVVRAYYPRFMARFPDLVTLAAAPLDDVLHAWQGLGYYRRARALHACAIAVATIHDGRLPADPDALAALPGIGPYTAAALAAIAFARPIVPVDGNVARVVARLLRIDTPLPRALPELRKAAQCFVDPARPGDVAQALMDLGAMLCTPRTPNCPDCPLASGCRAHRAGDAASLPRRAPRTARPERRGVAFLLRRGDGAVLLRRRPDRGLLGGMIELPSSPWEERPISLDDALVHAPVGEGWRLLPGRVRHVFTHFALELDLVVGRARPEADGIWCAPDALHRQALPTLTRKLLAHGGLPVHAGAPGRAQSLPRSANNPS